MIEAEEEEKRERGKGARGKQDRGGRSQKEERINIRNKNISTRTKKSGKVVKNSN